LIRSGRFVDYGLNSVTVRIEHIGGKIVFAVFGMIPRTTIVTAPMSQRCLIKGRHGITGQRRKGNMKTLARHRCHLGSQLDGELIASAWNSISNRRFIRPYPDLTKRGQGGIIEGGRTRKISNRQRKMMEHFARVPGAFHLSKQAEKIGTQHSSSPLSQIFFY
jgi:hypothetical protein